MCNLLQLEIDYFNLYGQLVNILRIKNQFHNKVKSQNSN